MDRFSATSFSIFGAEPEAEMDLASCRRDVISFSACLAAEGDWCLALVLLEWPGASSCCWLLLVAAGCCWLLGFQRATCEATGGQWHSSAALPISRSVASGLIKHQVVQGPRKRESLQLKGSL